MKPEGIEVLRVGLPAHPQISQLFHFGVDPALIVKQTEVVWNCWEASAHPSGLQGAALMHWYLPSNILTDPGMRYRGYIHRLKSVASLVQAKIQHTRLMDKKPGGMEFFISGMSWARTTPTGGLDGIKPSPREKYSPPSSPLHSKFRPLAFLLCTSCIITPPLLPSSSNSSSGGKAGHASDVQPKSSAASSFDDLSDKSSAALNGTSFEKSSLWALVIFVMFASIVLVTSTDGSRRHIVPSRSARYLLLAQAPAAVQLRASVTVHSERQASDLHVYYLLPYPSFSTNYAINKSSICRRQCTYAAHTRQQNTTRQLSGTQRHSSEKFTSNRQDWANFGRYVENTVVAIIQTAGAQDAAGMSSIQESMQQVFDIYEVTGRCCIAGYYVQWAPVSSLKKQDWNDPKQVLDRILQKYRNEVASGHPVANKPAMLAAHAPVPSASTGDCALVPVVRNTTPISGGPVGIDTSIPAAASKLTNDHFSKQAPVRRLQAITHDSYLTV
ncbi:hypothetical protein FIBSPDRAFT_883794 [Athelia psychrophila]|uniref:Uncharacterized protein n=1 Tax=Athelia psychrophila TaxID=1759441 RepID=A0A166TXZ9_9AGAM|nr:hypothetical protein FIBSPDRAFT_883794 [Fibularhizoctonia sp. CBS 109695]